jgi:hypothetical protein
MKIRNISGWVVVDNWQYGITTIPQVAAKLKGFLSLTIMRNTKTIPNLTLNYTEILNINLL